MGHKLNPLADLSGEQVDFPGLPAAQDDASQVSGQDPQSLFGIPISYQSGAAGKPAPGGGGEAPPDANHPNQDPRPGPNPRGSPGRGPGPGGARLHTPQHASRGRPPPAA